jgi:hypothetical protein
MIRLPLVGLRHARRIQRPCGLCRRIAGTVTAMRSLMMPVMRRTRSMTLSGLQLTAPVGEWQVRRR